MRIMAITILAALAIISQAQGQTVTKGAAVDELIYIFQHSPKEVATALVANAGNQDATGEAFRLVVKALLAKTSATKIAESRSGLSEPDRAILKAVKADAVFEPAEVFPEKINPALELKLDTKEATKQ